MKKEVVVKLAMLAFAVVCVYFGIIAIGLVTQQVTGVDVVLGSVYLSATGAAVTGMIGLITFSDW